MRRPRGLRADLALAGIADVDEAGHYATDPPSAIAIEVARLSQ